MGLPLDPFILDLLNHPGKAEALIASSDTKTLGNILISLQVAEKNSLHPNATSLLQLFSSAVNPDPTSNLDY